MKRNVLWLLSTISAVVLLFGYHTSTAGSLASAPGTALAPSAQPGRSTVTTGHSGGGGGGNGGGTTQATTTVTGNTVQTQWGPVQVQLTVKNGTITHVSVLQYPSGNPQDQQINSYALPILVQNTLDAQSAQIDMVSGATITSTGYVQSLQSALDQAGL